MSERKELVRQAFLLASIAAYLASLFLTWWEITIIGGSEPDRVVRSDGLGSAFSATSELSELCVVIAVTILILAATALRSHDRRLLIARRQLAIALVIFNFLAVLELWRSTSNAFPASDYRGNHLDSGAYAAIDASLLVLFSVLVLDAGGVRDLFRRKRAPRAEPSS